MTSASDQLLEVVTALLVESGYEGVSVRRVATRAGVSIGAVQHHFPTKDAMLEAAMDRVSTQFRNRLRERIPLDADPEQALGAVADELLGARDDQRTATILWTLRLARAAVDPKTAQVHAGEWQQVEDLLARLLLASRPSRGQAWAAREAGGLLALVDGLATALVLEPARMSPARGRELLQDQLDRVLEDPHSDRGDP